MGCEASTQVGFDGPLDQELQQELNFKAVNKKGEQVDRFQVNKPEQGFNIVAPPTQNSEPQKNLKLEFVNGFAIDDSRQNMFWSNTKDQIIYPAAALGVVMNINSLKQRYMGTGVNKEANGHTDNVLTLGVDSTRKRVLTGSIGAKPSIIMWDANTMEILGRSNLPRNTRAVSTLRFSKDGKYFFCSDKHNDSNVYCFDATTCQLLGQNKCGSDPIFDAQSGDDNTFAVATKRGMWFFEGPTMQKKKGTFNGNEMAAMITVTYDNDSKVFYSGTAAGNIYVWQGGSCIKTFKLHEGSVMGLAYASGKLLSSGSKDSTVKISKDGQVLQQFKITGYAKSLDLLNGNLLVSTKFGQILTINEQTGAQKQVMKGHWTGQAWGLAIGNDNNIYTTADDNTIICFNPSTNKVEKTGVISDKLGKIKKIGGASTLSLLAPNKHSRAIALNKAGHVAIGTNEGEDLTTVLFQQKVARQWIEVMKYSPDESMLAVGSHDNNIYIYKVDGTNYSLHGKLTAHNSFITNLDWSRDGQFIQSNCGAYELLFFDVNSLKQLKNGATQLKDQKWATYTCKLGWWVQGIFPPATSGDHVNGVHRNNSQDTIATGDDWGFVNLYGNPNTKGAKCKAYRAHSSHVVRVMFDKKDEYLYSIGGYDKTLMKWKVC